MTKCPAIAGGKRARAIASEEEAGCFRHFPVDAADSDRTAVREFILSLENLENEAQA